jgi:hypothetical protein
VHCFHHLRITAVDICARCGRAARPSGVIDAPARMLYRSCQAACAAGITLHPLALTSLVLGIVGLICICVTPMGGIAFGVPAALMGWLARRHIAAAKQGTHGLPLATVGLALGIAGVAIGAVVWGQVGSVVGFALGGR